MEQIKLTFIEQSLQQLKTEGEQAQFKYFYFKNCKNLTTAYFLLIFFGVFGFHKLYLNKKVGWLYFLFCWTGIPMLLVFVDFFLLPFQVTKYNRGLTISLVELIKFYRADNLSLINIEQKISNTKTKRLEWIAALLLIFGVIIPVVAYASLFFSHHKLELHYKAINPDGSQNDSIVSF